MDLFERLTAVMERVARHSYYPGKQEAVDLCLEVIGGLSRERRISDGQANVLRVVLLGSFSHAA